MKELSPVWITSYVHVKVLQTIPWDKVDIEVMTIETNHAGEVFPGSKQEIRDYLEDKGYVYAHTVGKDYAGDVYG